jgi:hypothetical protein
MFPSSFAWPLGLEPRDAAGLIRRQPFVKLNLCGLIRGLPLNLKKGTTDGIVRMVPNEVIYATCAGLNPNATRSTSALPTFFIVFMLTTHH